MLKAVDDRTEKERWPMYRTEYRRLGCIGWVLVAVVAGSLGAPLLMAPFALLFGSAQVGPYAPLFWVVAMLLMGMAFRRITTRVVPICPHCGAATETAFRICRRCGRVKGMAQ